MNKEAKGHHFISQFYLRGFTKSSGKKEKLTILDIESRNRFYTEPKNVAKERDFNLINIKGVLPSELENNLSKFEADVAKAIRNVTCNRPVVLQWKHPDKIPVHLHDSPGFACLETGLIFPLTKRLLLIGNFERGRDENVKSLTESVAFLNSAIIYNAMHQVYAPSLNFSFAHFKTGTILSGQELLKIFKS